MKRTRTLSEIMRASDDELHFGFEPGAEELRCAYCGNEGEVTMKQVGARTVYWHHRSNVCCEKQVLKVGIQLDAQVRRYEAMVSEQPQYTFELVEMKKALYDLRQILRKIRAEKIEGAA